MEYAVLGLFCIALIFCIAFGFSILYALLFGLLVFIIYGLWKGFSIKDLLIMAFEGVKTIKNLLITFLLIGILTAVWRAAGTIPAIVSYASVLIHPSVFLLAAFILNCAVSLLTGTSFGTSATMGVICMTIASAMGINPVFSGGAVLSGIFFGDRCSPVSTSALLVSELTGTNIFENIKRMIKSAVFPFLISCAVYAVLGSTAAHSGEMPDLRSNFSTEFSISWVLLAPALVILVLSAFHVDVKITMTASIIAGTVLCILVQHRTLVDVLRIAVMGFYASDPDIAPMIDGGGLISMLRVAGIVCISSSYSVIFQKTGLLSKAKKEIDILSVKATPFTAVFFTSVISSVIACNQTLTIILVDQLCKDLDDDPYSFANDLEDSAAVIPPLIPWSIAGSVPLSVIGAPVSSIIFACYLYLLPLWKLGRSFAKKRS